MRRQLRLVSFALVCLAVTRAAAQKGSPFVPASILPVDAPMDEYAVTADRNRVYYSSLRGEVLLYDRKSSKTTHIADGGVIWDIAVANNGSAVAFTRSGEGGKDYFIWTVPLDSVTGLAKGPQRRASMMPGDDAAFSHDGRSLAFAREDSAGTSLVVLPTLGGPEHVLGSFPSFIDNIRWTPDGKSLVFLVHPPRRDPSGKATIQEISLSGGPPKTLGQARRGWSGLSPDGSLIAFGDSGSRRSFVLADRTGHPVGAFTPPPGFDIDTWTNGGIVASRIRNVFRTHSYSLVDGTSRVVVDSIGGASWPLWSPDGKRIAFAVTEGSNEVIVTSPDGSSSRSIRLERPFGHSVSWSPDGRWILYSTNGLPTTAVAIEMATGKQVPLATSDRDIFTRWTDDSRGVFVVIGGQNGTTRTLSLREVDLTGASKELLQIPGGPGSYLFPFDRKSALVRRGVDRPMMLESLSGGRDVEIMPATPGFSSGPILSPSGQWIAFRRNPQGNTNAVFSTLDIARMDGSSHRSIELPFNISPGAAAFLPGDQQLLVSERASPNAKDFQFTGGAYLVTLGSRETKKLFTFRTFKTAFAQLSLSPDGKSIVYTSRDSLPAGYATLDVSSVLKSKP